MLTNKLLRKISVSTSEKVRFGENLAARLASAVNLINDYMSATQRVRFPLEIAPRLFI